MSIHGKLFHAVLVVTLGTTLQLAHGQDVPPVTTPPAASTPVDPAAGSYSLGLYFGSQLHNSGLDGTVSLEQLERGIREGLGGKVATDEDKARMSHLLSNAREAVAARNHAQARDYLAKNATVDGVVTTTSGLQYRVFAPGDGKAASPKLRDHVTVNYRGHLIDGTEFDNSDTHPQAAVFTVGSVLMGWNEALLKMKPGAKWRLFVPPELAYGDNSPSLIPPGALLIFDLELLKVESPSPLSQPHRNDAPTGKQAAAKTAPPAAQAP
jgi:FKBP-type peptidyl-prolyl cis-trans isomerase